MVNEKLGTEIFTVIGADMKSDGMVMRIETSSFCLVKSVVRTNVGFVVVDVSLCH